MLLNRKKTKYVKWKHLLLTYLSSSWLGLSTVHIKTGRIKVYKTEILWYQAVASLACPGRHCWNTSQAAVGTLLTCHEEEWKIGYYGQD